MVGQPAVQNQFTAMAEKVNLVIQGLQKQSDADRRRLQQLEKSVDARREEAANRGDGREKWAELQGSVNGIVEEMQEMRRRIESLDERLYSRTQGTEQAKKRTSELEQQVNNFEQTTRLSCQNAEEAQKRQASKLRRAEHSIEELGRRLVKIEEEARSHNGTGQRLSYLETRVAELEQQQEQLAEQFEAELQSMQVAIEGYHSVNAVGADGAGGGHESFHERHAALEDRLEAAERGLGAVEKKVSDLRVEELSKSMAAIRVKVEGQTQRVGTLAERLEKAHEPALDALRAELTQVRNQDRRETDAFQQALQGRVQEAHEGHEETLSAMQDQIRQVHSHVASMSNRPEENDHSHHLVRTLHERMESHEREVSVLRERVEAHPAFSQPGHHGGGTTPEEGVPRDIDGEDLGHSVPGMAELEEMHRRVEWLEEQVSSHAAVARQQSPGTSQQTHNTVCDLVEQVSRLNQRASSSEATQSSIGDKVHQLQLLLERSSSEDSISTRGLSETSAKVGALTSQVADMSARLLEVEGHIDFSKESGLPPFGQASAHLGGGSGHQGVPPLPHGKDRGIEAQDFNSGDRSPSAPLDIQDALQKVASHLEIVDDLERRIDILEHRVNGEDDDDEVNLSLGNKGLARASGGVGAASDAEAPASDGKAMAVLMDRLEVLESNVMSLQATPKAEGGSGAKGDGLDLDQVQDMIDDLSSKVTSTISAVVDDLSRLETTTEDRAREMESTLSGFTEAIETLQADTDQLREVIAEGAKPDTAARDLAEPAEPPSRSGDGPALETVEKRLQALEESSGGLTTRVDKLGEGHAAHAKQVEQLATDFSGHRAHVEELSVDWRKHREMLDAKSEEHAGERAEVKKLLEEWRGHKEGVDALKSEHEKRSSVMDALRCQFENYSSKVEDLHKEKEKKPDHAHGAEIGSRICDLEAKIAELTKEAKVEDVEDSLSEIRKVQDSHSAKFEQLVSSRDLHAEHIEDLKKKVAATPAAPTEAKAQGDSVEELMSKVSSVEVQLAKQSSEIAAIEGKSAEAHEDLKSKVSSLEGKLEKHSAEIVAAESKAAEAQDLSTKQQETVEAADKAAAVACEKTAEVLQRVTAVEKSVAAAMEKASSAEQAAAKASEKATAVEKAAGEAAEKAEAASASAAAASEKAGAAEKAAAGASEKAAEAEKAASAVPEKAATASSDETKEAPAGGGEALAKEAMAKVDQVREELKEVTSRLDEQADIATKTMEAVQELTESVAGGEGGAAADKLDALFKEVQQQQGTVQETVAKLEGSFEKRLEAVEGKLKEIASDPGAAEKGAGDSSVEKRLSELQERLEAAEKIAVESAAAAAASPSGAGEASVKEQVQAEVTSCVSKVQEELKQLAEQHHELKDTKTSLSDLSEKVASLSKGAASTDSKIGKVEDRLKVCESTSNAIKKEFDALAGPRKVGIGMASDGPSPLAAFRGTISDLTAQVADLQSRVSDSTARGAGGSGGPRSGNFDHKDASLDFSLTEQSRIGSKDHPGDSLNFSLTESRKDLSISETTLPGAARRTPHTLQPILGRSGSPNSSASFDSDAGSSPKSAGSTPSSATSKEKKSKKHKDHKEHKIKAGLGDFGDLPDIQLGGRHKHRSDSGGFLDGGGSGDDALDSLVSGSSRSGPRDRPRPSPVVTNFDDERGGPLATVAEEEELGDTNDQSLSQKSKSKDEGATPAGGTPAGNAHMPDSPASASGGALDTSLVSNSNSMFGVDIGGGVDFSVDDSTELEKCDHIEVVMPIPKSGAPSSAASSSNPAPAAPAAAAAPAPAGETTAPPAAAAAKLAEEAPASAASAASRSGPPSEGSARNSPRSPRSRTVSHSPRSHSEASTPAGTPAAKAAPRPASAAIGLGGASSAGKPPGDEEYAEDSFADDISVPEESMEDPGESSGEYGSEEV